jgi:hypothetical protein
VTDVTQLAHGQINAADELVVQLIRPDDMPAAERTLSPAVVRIVWPLQSTIVNQKHFPEVAAMLTRLFAEAATTLAQINARRRL